MAWLRRGKPDPTINVTVVNGGPQAPPASPPPAKPVEDEEAKAALIEAARGRIRRATSIRARVKKLFTDFGWITILFFAVSLLVWPSGWEVVVGSFIVFNLGMYAYTKWVYKPPTVPVVLYRDDGSGGVLNAWAIPIEIWDDVVKVGLSNTIRTALGTTYLIRGITFDDDAEKIPVAIEFSWLHYNELNFATKRGIFEELAKLNQITTEENNRYKWLMDNVTTRKAVVVAKGWLRRMSNSRSDPLAKLDEQNLRAEIEKFARDAEKLQMQGLDEGELQAFSAESESGVGP